MAAVALKLDMRLNTCYNGIPRKHKIGKNKLYANLRYLQFLQEEPYKNIPFETYIDLGYFTFTNFSRNNHHGFKPLMTEAGLKWLENELRDIIIESEREYLEEYYTTNQF